MHYLWHPDGWACGGKKLVWTISKAICCRIMILGRDIGCYRCLTSFYDLDLTVDHSLVTLTFLVQAISWKA